MILSCWDMREGCMWRAYGLQSCFKKAKVNRCLRCCYVYFAVMRDGPVRSKVRLRGAQLWGQEESILRSLWVLGERVGCSGRPPVGSREA